MTAQPPLRGHHPTNSLDVLRDAFALLVTGPEPLAIDGSLFPGLPDRMVPLDEVRDLLLARRCPVRTSDAVWSWLVERSRLDGGAWTVGAAGVALPALVSVAAALGRRCPGDREDLCAEILRGFLEALHRIDLGRPRIVLRLRWAAYRAGYAVLVDALAAKNRAAAEYAQPVVWGHPDFVLARALAEGILTTTEADLIGTTRLESVRIKQWAAEHGMGVWATYKARRRAELRLAAWLRADLVDSDPADALTDQVATVVAIGKSKHVSKRDRQSGLQADEDLPPTTTSEARPCA